MQREKSQEEHVNELSCPSHYTSGLQISKCLGSHCLRRRCKSGEQALRISTVTLVCCEEMFVPSLGLLSIPQLHWDHTYGFFLLRIMNWIATASATLCHSWPQKSQPKTKMSWEPGVGWAQLCLCLLHACVTHIPRNSLGHSSPGHGRGTGGKPSHKTTGQAFAHNMLTFHWPKQVATVNPHGMGGQNIPFYWESYKTTWGSAKNTEMGEQL